MPKSAEANANSVEDGSILEQVSASSYHPERKKKLCGRINCAGLDGVDAIRRHQIIEYIGWRAV